MKGEGSAYDEKIEYRNPPRGFILKIFKWENPREEKAGEGFSNYYTSTSSFHA